MIQAFLVKASVWLTFFGTMAELAGKSLLEFAKLNDSTDSVYNDVVMLSEETLSKHDPDKAGVEAALDEYGQKFDSLMTCASVLDIIAVSGVYLVLSRAGFTGIAEAFIVAAYGMSSYASFYFLRCNRKSLAMVDRVMAVLKTAFEDETADEEAASDRSKEEE